MQKLFNKNVQIGKRISMKSYEIPFKILKSDQNPEILKCDQNLEIFIEILKSWAKQSRMPRPISGAGRYRFQYKHLHLHLKKWSGTLSIPKLFWATQRLSG